MLEHLVVDALLVLDPALGVGAGDDLAAELGDLLDGVDGDVAGAVDDDVLALEGVAVGLEVLVHEVDQAVAGGLGAGEGAAEGEALAGQDAGPLVADALVLTEHVGDLTAADAEVAGGNVGVGADVAAELGHEGLAEVHDLVVGLALGVEVGAALAAAHGKGREGVLENLLEAEELQHAEGDRGVEAQAALVGPDGGVELDAVAAVDLDLAGVVDPGHAEHDDALRLDEALEDSGLLVLGVSVKGRLKGAQDLGGSLDELLLLGIALLELCEDVVAISHALSYRLGPSAGCLSGLIYNTKITHVVFHVMFRVEGRNFIAKYKKHAENTGSSDACCLSNLKNGGAVNGNLDPRTAPIKRPRETKSDPRLSEGRDQSGAGDGSRTRVISLEG